MQCPYRVQVSTCILRRIICKIWCQKCRNMKILMYIFISLFVAPVIHQSNWIESIKSLTNWDGGKTQNKSVNPNSGMVNIRKNTNRKGKKQLNEIEEKSLCIMFIKFQENKYRFVYQKPWLHNYIVKNLRKSL